jgi:hypothetical protein
MAEPVRHRQTKEAATDMFYLKPPRHISTLPWLCENARALGGDSRSYSFKAVLAVKLASTFDLENKMKNVILAVFRSFAFLHMG